VNMRGKQRHLWRAVDQDGDMIDIPVQKHRNAGAAKRSFRKLLKGQVTAPWRLVTDELRSYSAAHRQVMPSVGHDTRQYAALVHGSGVRTVPPLPPAAHTPV
jgi:putative transposase